MASWGSYVFELCRINANQGLTAEIDWNYTSWSRRCRKILIGLVVRGAKTVVVRGKNRILTRNRKKPEMTVPISQKTRNDSSYQFDPKPQKTRNDSSYQSDESAHTLILGGGRAFVNCGAMPMNARVPGNACPVGSEDQNAQFAYSEP